ncbi:MAG: LysR family transcriptional regulator [Roseovarius sp.]|nr:LysR family transcriptional regulator [Roseovarius sp.]
MDIVWLKDFEALVAQKNFSRAAEERNVSQPAFSRRMRALEDDIGVKLINRQTLPLSLTPAGEVFLSQARMMLRTYQETLDRCQKIDAAGGEVLRFATSESLYLTHFKTHIAPLVEECGLDIDLNSTSWGADQFVSALQQSYCDVILTYWHPSMDFLAPLEVSTCDYVTLTKDQIVPVVRAGSEYALSGGKRNPVPLLSYGMASALRSVQDDLVHQQMGKINIFTVNQNALAISIKAMILEGFGMGWLPRRLCQDELDRGQLVIVDETMSSELEIRLYRGTETLKPTLEKFWALLQARTAMTSKI